MERARRERGVLTEADREFLRGDREYQSLSNERAARQRIRQRVRDAIQDFGLLFNYLEPRDRNQILDEFARRTDDVQRQLNEESRSEGPPELVWDLVGNRDQFPTTVSTGGLRHVQAFVLLLLIDGIRDELEASNQQFAALVGALVEEGLEDAFGRKGVVVDADVDVQFEERDVDPTELRARFEEGHDAVADEDVEHLVHLRKISWEEYESYLEDEM